MEVVLNLTSNRESNIFLRALWAEFRSSFGKCAWQYTPYKDSASSRVCFGWVDLGFNGSVRISVSYKQKGVIAKLLIEDIFQQNSQAIKLSLLEAIKRALVNTSNPSIYHIQSHFESYFGSVENYLGEHFRLYNVDDKLNCIIYEVEGFDEIDALTEGQKMIGKVLDFLAVCTNSSFSLQNTQIFDGQANLDIQEIFFENLEWIDDYPRVGKSLLLWKTQKNFIDRIMTGDVELDHPFLRASSHFHTAEKTWISNTSIVGNMAELASILYVSSLEVATELYPLDVSTCKECGQAKYSIRKRVKELVRNHLNKHIEKFIDDYYTARSKYLHVGILSSDSSYMGTSIPQLDPTSASGCRIQASSSPINLKEFTSYILRSVFRQKMSNGDVT